MASKKVVKTSQGGIAILSMLTLLVVSGATVTALNPIIEDSSANIDSGRVAGINTQTSQKLPLEVTTTKIVGKFVIQPNSTTTEDNVLSTFAAYTSKIEKGSFIQDLVKIYNPNNQIVKTQVKFYMPENLKGKVKVYLEDNKDSLIMYTIEQSYGPKTITLPELGQRDFKIRVDSLEEINQDIQFVFVFTVGQ